MLLLTAAAWRRPPIRVHSRLTGRTTPPTSSNDCQLSHRADSEPDLCRPAATARLVGVWRILFLSEHLGREGFNQRPMFPRIRR